MPESTSALARAQKHADKIPILGGLFLCSARDHYLALKEFTIALIFSTATFWMSAWLLMFLTLNDQRSFVEILKSTVSNGELFIFAVGFIGSTLIVAFDDPTDARQFPGKLWHAVGLFVLGLLCAGAFALVRLASEQSSALSLNRQILLSASIWLSAVTCVLRYLAIVYRKFTLRPDEAMKSDERGFAAAFTERHKDDAP